MCPIVSGTGSPRLSWLSFYGYCSLLYGIVALPIEAALVITLHCLTVSICLAELCLSLLRIKKLYKVQN